MTVFPAGRTVVDREQVRRDAANMPTPYERLVLALLAELEQAERELRLAIERAVDAERDTQSAIVASVEALGFAEARLARVPALVESLRALVPVARKFAASIGPAEYPADLADLEVIVDAHVVLAEWERA